MKKAAEDVDGFVVPVPKKNIEAYRGQMSETANRVWKKPGALEHVECVADGVKPGKSRPARRRSSSRTMKSSCSHGPFPRPASTGTTFSPRL